MFSSSRSTEEPASWALMVGGFGLIGGQHVYDFKNQKDADLAAMCDVYQPRLEQGVAACGQSAKPYSDFRKMLENRDLQAIEYGRARSIGPSGATRPLHRSLPPLWTEPQAGGRSGCPPAARRSGSNYRARPEILLSKWTSRSAR